MAHPARLVLLGLGLFLVLLPLSVGRPGVPVTLKADEPAYLLMTLSLIEDGDLLCERRDIRRLVDRYPYLPVENLIVMSRDDWNTVFFGKPYLYSLLAAPAAALADQRGLVAFNMLLLLGMVWMGTVYLRSFNPEWLAALFAGAFFLLSSAFAYVFWLQPEILNMFSVTATLFFAFHRFDRAPAAGSWRRLRALFGHHTATAWSGALLAIAVYHKPMLALMGVPALWVVFRRRGWRQAVVWLVAAALALGIVVGLSYALTGQAIAYLGAARIGVKVEDPERYGELVASLRTITRAVVASHGDEAAQSYTWLARVPELFPRMLLENLGYFLWGRHTGLLVYMPFSAICLLLFLLRPPRAAERWVTVASMAGLALFFLVWIHYNWHGGAGFIGNRYFVNAYPGFLFLVTAIRPAWLLLPGFAAAGVFLAPIVFAPYGAPVPRPTLQSHTRGAAYELLPVELSLRAEIPGYQALTAHGAVLWGRQDLFRVVDPAAARFQVWGATASELWISSARPLPSLLFAVSSPPSENVVTLSLGRDRQRLLFDAGGPRSGERLVELDTSGAARARSQWGQTRYAYRLRIATRTGVNPRHPDGTVRQPQFYAGAELAFLGSRAELERPSHYRIAWLAARPPERPIAAGQRFEVRARLRNDSDTVWRSTGLLPVRLSWHWLDPDERPVVYDGLRTPLATPLAPGETRRVDLRVIAPEQPGSYLLVLDAVREQIGWFSSFDARTLHLPIEVAPREGGAG